MPGPSGDRGQPGIVGLPGKWIGVLVGLIHSSISIGLPGLSGAPGLPGLKGPPGQVGMYTVFQVKSLFSLIIHV